MNKKILVLDDEQDILLSIKMLTESLGYKTTIANNVNTAFKLLETEKFDLMLLDILMPQMSGREVLQKIRANKKLKNQKVAIVTVIQLSPKGKEALNKLKPVDYINKPVEANELKKRLGKILNDSPSPGTGKK